MSTMLKSNQNEIITKMHYLKILNNENKKKPTYRKKHKSKN